MKNKKVQYFTIDERPISKKEFIRTEKEDAIVDCLSRKEIIARKLLTESEINKLIEVKIILPIKYKREFYFNKDAIAKGVKQLKERVENNPK